VSKPTECKPTHQTFVKFAHSSKCSCTQHADAEMQLSSEVQKCPFVAHREVPRGTNPSPLKFTISSTSCVYSHSEVKKQPLNLIQEVVSTHIHLEPPRTVKISQNYCTLQITCDPKMALGFSLRDADMINGISFLFSQ